MAYSLLFIAQISTAAIDFVDGRAHNGERDDNDLPNDDSTVSLYFSVIQRYCVNVGESLQLSYQSAVLRRSETWCLGLGNVHRLSV